MWSDGEMITIVWRITLHLVMCKMPILRHIFHRCKPTRLLSNFVQINCGANDSFNSELESSTFSLCGVLKCDDRNGRWPSDAYELVDYMKVEFCDVAINEVHKGDNVGWYLDQRLVSILISDWIQQRGPGRVKLVARNIGADRSATIILSDSCCVARDL